MSSNLKLYLIGVVTFLIFIALFAFAYHAKAAKPQGAPKSTSAEAQWFANAKNKNNARCCDEADGYREGLSYPYASAASPDGREIYLRDWKATDNKGGEYDVNVLGWWIHVDKDHVIKCPDPKEHKACNPTGGAVVWIMWHWNKAMTELDKNVPPLGVLCFAPGNQF